MNQRTEAILQDVRRRAGRRNPKAPVRHWLLRRSPDADASSFFRDLGGVLAEAGRDVLSLTLPRSSLDAGEHVLGQLCEAFDVGSLPRASFSADYPIHKRIAWIARPFGLEKSAPFLLLDIPQRWLVSAWDPRRTLPDVPRTILEALLKSGLDAVVISTESPPWLRRLLTEGPEGELPARAASSDLLLNEHRWGSARDEARRVARALGPAAAAVPPAVLVLGVACSALGQRVEAIAAMLQRSEPSRDLLDILRSEVRRHPTWQPALRRRTLPRFPIPREIMDALSGPMEDAQQALVDCLTHPEQDGVRTDAVLRELIDDHTGEPEARARLADHYRTLDGVRTAEEAIRARRVIPWLERIHHLAHQGPAGLTALKGIVPLSRMSRYELAWSLSVEFKEYERAAAIYRDLSKERPEDAYSHHYWAWNLDQEGKDLQTVWTEYKNAIKLDPENPWYNSRYITFLRDNGFQRDAREAWREALPIVCASRRWAKMPDLPRHFHRWVARSALDAGDLVLAREVLGSLPESEIIARPKLSALLHELDHFSEIDRLGEPIYPISVPIRRRWKESVLLPGEIELPEVTLARRAFYPGRVVVVEKDTVTLVLADPAQDLPDLSTTEMPVAEITALAAGEPPEVGRFLELGVYDGERMMVRYHPREANVMDRRSFDRSLRYLCDDTLEDPR